MPGIKLTPYGEHEGRPSLQIDVADVDIDNELCLVEAVNRNRLPGVGLVELIGVVPWGSRELDRALLMLAADGRTAETVSVWAHRKISSERWASIPIWWVHDASELLDKPLTSRQLVDAINDLPYVPQPTELIAVCPHPQVITAVVLDELATRLDCASGWLYVDNEESARIAEREVARASTTWGVRRHGGAK